LFRIGYYHSLTQSGKFVPRGQKPHAKVKTFSVMSFLNPLFLTALATVAIPLLIYLFNLRKPKKVRFSTLAFFDSLKSTALKRLRIKRWLLLSLRMLAILAMVIAASRPILSDGPAVVAGNDQEPNVIGILIDNSPGMMQIDKNGPLIDQARSIAQQITGFAESGDRIVLEVSHGESMNLPYMDRRGARMEISTIESRIKGGYTAERIQELKVRLENAPEPNKILYIVTSAKAGHFASVSGLSENEEDPAVRVRIVKVGEEPGSNIGFVSVETEEGTSDIAGSLQLRTTIRNFGDQQVPNLFLSLFTDGELVVQQPVSLAGDETGEFLFSLPEIEGSVLEAELRIEGDELTYDNRYYLTIQKPQPRNILAISGAERNAEVQSYLSPLLELMAEDEDRYSVRFKNLQVLEVSELASYDAVVMNGLPDIPDYLLPALIDHVQQGAGLLFLPDSEGDLRRYNILLSGLGAGNFTGIVGSYGSFRSIDRISAPEMGHPLLEDLFERQTDDQVRLNEPELYYYLEMDQGGRSMNLPLLRGENGTPIISEVNSGNGKLIVSAIGSDPGWSNFPIKPFFAPFFYRAIEYLARGEGSVEYNHRLGSAFTTVLPGEVNPENVRLIRNGEEIMPEIRQTFRGTEIVYQGEEWSPGRVVVDAGDPENEQQYSLNLSTMESSLQTLSETELEQIFGNRFADVRVINTVSNSDNVTGTLQSASFSREIWFWFIIAAILLLVMESLISRFYKVESTA
jgi:hypothetical protein